MNYKIAGLSPKALKYIDTNSKLLKDEYIGCSRSYGVIQTESSLYKTELIENTPIYLFKHTLKNNKYAYGEIQEVREGFVFINLLLDDGKKLKWTKKEINIFLADNKNS